jgi:hypothetical protein
MRLHALHLVALAALAFLTLLLTAAPARAQVATPNLAPADGATTGNPATLPFAPSSFVGVLGGQHTGTVQDSSGATIADGTARTAQAHLRLVGPHLALALQYVSGHVELNQSGATVISQTDNDNQADGGLGLRLGERLSVGIAVEQDRSKGNATLGPPLLGTTATQDQTVRSTLPYFGAVLRLGDALFVGATYGKEKIHGEVSTSAPASGSFDATRAVWRYGVGLLSIGQGGNAFRLELAAEHRDPYDLSASVPITPGAAQDKREGVRGVLELRGGDWLVSYAERQDKVYNAGTRNRTETQQGIIVGRVPMAGWAVTLDYFKDRVDSATINTRTDFDIYALSVHRMF